MALNLNVKRGEVIEFRNLATNDSTFLEASVNCKLTIKAPEHVRVFRAFELYGYKQAKEKIK